MHDSVLEWVPTVLPPSVVAGRSVLEVGAGDVNGSVRPSIVAGAPASYLGVDVTPGPGVDRVLDVVQLVEEFGSNAFDIVVSTEMLEHVADWRGAVLALATVAADRLVITTRSPGFPYHPFPEDNWRFTVEQMGAILAAVGFVYRQVLDDPQHPGVFAVARKSKRWRPLPPAALDDIDVPTAP